MDLAASGVTLCGAALNADLRAGTHMYIRLALHVSKLKFLL
jgi:hypothetical protein